MRHWSNAIRSAITTAFAATLSFGAGSVATASTLYSNGFETDISGWFTPTRVPSGTGGITSASGSFHATTAAGSSDFTRWGGYNYGAGNAVPTVFQEYFTSVDIYLDVDGGWANNTRLDFSSAINNAAGIHLSDFIFNGGFFNDAGAPGSGNRFVFSASNNSQPGSAFAKNPARAPVAISTEGWYTFQHHFYNLGGFLAVDMTITDSLNALVASWSFNPSAPVGFNAAFAIAGVGGNRYGWFDFSEFSTLAFDNSELSAVPEPGTMILLGAGLVGIAAKFRNKKHRSIRGSR